METAADVEWLLRAVGSGVPGALAVFEIRGDLPFLVAANEAYMSLFRSPAPSVGEPARHILPGDDPQIDRIVRGVLDGDAFMAESWAIPAPQGTYSTGVAYCDWSLRKVDEFGVEALVLVLTDATRRTERSLGLVEEVVRLRESGSVI